MRYYRIAQYRKAEDRKAEAEAYRARTAAAQARTRDPILTNNPAIVRYMDKQIPTVDLKLCDYHKATKKLTLASEYMGMPQQFFVKSHYTGKEVRFVEIGPYDILYDEDGFDGEQKIYRPTTDLPNVDHLVIYHQY